jgi:hypothetical protein
MRLDDIAVHDPESPPGDTGDVASVRERTWRFLLGADASTASLDQRLAAVDAGWNQGVLTNGAVDSLYFDAAVFDGFDATLSRLDARRREALFETLQAWALADPAEQPINLSGAVYAYEWEPDPEKAARMKREVDDAQAAEDAYFMNVIRPRINAWWATAPR